MNDKAFKACETEGCAGNAHSRNPGAARGKCPACYRRWKRGSDNTGPARTNVGLYTVSTKVPLHAWDALTEYAVKKGVKGDRLGEPTIHMALRLLLEEEINKYAWESLPDSPPTGRGDSIQVQTRVPATLLIKIDSLMIREAASRYRVLANVINNWAMRQKTAEKHSNCAGCGTFRAA